MLSTMVDIQYDMIEDVKDEDIFWLHETLNQLKRKLNNLNMLEEKKIEVKCSTKINQIWEISSRRRIPKEGEYIDEH